MKVDYYKILGVSPDADTEQIKTRYRFLCNAFHPDKFPTGQREQAEEEFKPINSAYQTLSVEEKRSAYDAARRQTSPATGQRETKQNAAPSSQSWQNTSNPASPTPKPIQFLAHRCGGIFALFEIFLSSHCKLFVSEEELRFWIKGDPDGSFEISSAILMKSTFKIRKRFITHELNIFLPDGKNYKIGLSEHSLNRVLDIIRKLKND